MLIRHRGCVRSATVCVVGCTLLTLAACRSQALVHRPPTSKPVVSSDPVAPQPTLTSTPTQSTSPPASPVALLPRGGRHIFPRFRVVAYYGVPGNAELGVLGAGTPEQAAAAV